MGVNASVLFMLWAVTAISLSVFIPCLAMNGFHSSFGIDFIASFTAASWFTTIVNVVLSLAKIHPY
jgi:hypothetical protein